eukprot:COSAG04_NODE_818_length_10080_cov_8.490532_2_plen_89_part_00
MEDLAAAELAPGGGGGGRRSAVVLVAELVPGGGWRSAAAVVAVVSMGRPTFFNMIIRMVRSWWVRLGCVRPLRGGCAVPAPSDHGHLR